MSLEYHLLNTEFSSSLSLPSSYRPTDILAFHRRDSQEIAERVGESSLEKGMVWHGIPARLSIRFRAGEAEADLSIEGRCSGYPEFESMVRRMLGFTQNIGEFEARFSSHPQLGRLIAERPGLRVPVAAKPFEALTWAVTGQQISVAAATTLRRKLILAANVRHSSGLLCYPDADQIAGLSENALHQAGFSAAKTNTLLTLSKLVADNKLPLDGWAQANPPVDTIREQLDAVRGIGPWTVNYTLLRGFGWLDGSLHGDNAVRRGLQALLGLPSRINERDAMRWLSQFSPWRALACAHIWASLSAFAS